MASWTKDVRIMAYLEPDIDSQRIDQIRTQLQALEGIDLVVFISGDTALEQLKSEMKRHQSIFDNLKVNPLPDSFELHPVHVPEHFGRFERLARFVEQIPEVSEVEYGEKWLGRIANIIKLFKITVYAMSALFIGASVFFVANTIRLVLYSKRDEVEIMKLVGASDRYIKTPFYINSLLHGGIGGGVGLAALYILFRLLETSVLSGLPANLVSLSFLPPEIACSIFGGSVMVGWIGCFLSLKRFLK